MTVDLRTAQLLCSRLCHDLVGPAGAVNAGLELLAEGGGLADEALALVGRSAVQVSRRLAFFRIAFGLGGGGEGGMDLAQARDLAVGFLDGGMVALDWPGGVGAGTRVDATAAKLLLNLILVGADALPRGGSLVMTMAVFPEGVGTALMARGKGARLRDDLRAALRPDASPEALSARTIHAFLAARLAEGAGLDLEIWEGVENEVQLAVLLPLAR